MSDNKRELLELAAKAAGIEIKWNPTWPTYKNGIHERRVVPEPDEPHSKWIPWNPLINDGDALRLAVKLGIRGVVGTAGAVLWEGECPYAATRLAIVRAAAEIGKAMP